MIYLISLGFLSFLVTKFLMSPLKALLSNEVALKTNFLGHKIPIAMGLALGLGILPAFLIYIYAFQIAMGFHYLFLLYITLLVGLIDDLLDNGQVKGLKGHFGCLFCEKKLTTGALKAIVISLLSFYYSYLTTFNIVLVFLNFFILVLITNAFNLLDVRPGRAIKAYSLFSIILIAIYPNDNYLWFFLAAILAYGVWDLKGQIMLGDTGSNFLGMSLGIFIVLRVGLAVKFILFLVLVYLHWYTERNSLTNFIENSYFWRKIDRLGRS